jgi:hypothetical protein
MLMANPVMGGVRLRPTGHPGLPPEKSKDDNGRTIGPGCWEESLGQGADHGKGQAVHLRGVSRFVADESRRKG